ncbi:caspase domain-containing protein [Thelephora terrestris]|uniref:Caspase domain-containing protein n=1 Tax=Thelephora terrestris TaxID=56493 RepID=A0A9P6HL60_9AGAM|nr:caspase domain-containing protein [Thelephora terrestris]
MTVEYSATTRGRSTKKKALLVGIGYPNGVEGNGQAVLDPIPTSIPNVKKFKEFIQDHWDYADADITVMTDEDGTEERLQPTEDNLMREIRGLCRRAEPGNRRIFYFSGHSGQLPCRTGTEEDGLDEALIASNGAKIRDNDLHECLVDPLPQGSALTAIFDCCHSGTLLDLPHHNCNNVCRPWVNKGPRRSRTLQNWNVRRNCRGTFNRSLSLPRSSVGSGGRFFSLDLAVQTMESSSSVGEDTSLLQGRSCTSPERLFECDGWCRSRMEPTSGALPHADVISISSSGDGQISWDASTRDGDSLSMTTYLVDILKKNPRLTYSQLMTSLNYDVHSFTTKMHGAAHREHDRREADRKHGIYEDTVVKEDTGLEMDNFQDLQLGSITPLDMDRIVVL